MTQWQTFSLNILNWKLNWHLLQLKLLIVLL